MAACPYDQLFIDPNTHTAEKCNFCANRVENQLQPACVSVCPTECRIFGDLDDPTSEVAQIVQREAFMVRKPEKGTGPKVFYLGADEASMRPGDRGAAVHVQGRPGAPAAARLAGRRTRSARAIRAWTTTCRTSKPWGIDLVLYLLAKGISTGAMFLSALLLAAGRSLAARRASRRRSISLVFVALHGGRAGRRSRAARALLLHPDAAELASWLAWGAVLLTAHGAVGRTLDRCACWLGWTTAVTMLAAAGARRSAIGATAYTGFLFAQGLARDLWQGPHATIDLLAQAAAEGARRCCSSRPSPAASADTHSRARRSTLALRARSRTWRSSRSSTCSRRARRSTTSSRCARFATASTRSCSGAARSAWAGSRRSLLVLFSSIASYSLVTLVAASLLALAGGFAWEYIWVEAGQSGAELVRIGLLGIRQLG